MSARKARPYKKYVPGPALTFKQIAVSTDVSDGSESLYGLTDDGKVYQWGGLPAGWSPVAMTSRGRWDNDGYVCQGGCDEDKATHQTDGGLWLCDTCKYEPGDEVEVPAKP